MDSMLTWGTAAFNGVVSLVLMAAVLSPRVHDGVVVKAGLISMSLGFGSIALRTADGLYAWDGIGLSHSMLLVTAGVAVVMVGYAHRVWRRGHPLRRARSDWVERRRGGDGRP